MKPVYTLWKRDQNGGQTGVYETFPTWVALLHTIRDDSTYYTAGHGWTIERNGEAVASTCTLIQFIEECCAHDAPWNGKPFYPGYGRFLEYLNSGIGY